MKKTALFQVMTFLCGMFFPLTACADEHTDADISVDSDKKVLVAYFSATGTTERVAEKVNEAAKGDIFKIEAAVPYTSADLNYNSDCRANEEQADNSARPAIANNLNDIAKYDVIFIGYPIWWGKAPKIIYTFLESHDFVSKTIIPFCTSGSSPVSGSEPELHALSPTAEWKDGRRFAYSVSQKDVNDWVASIMQNSNEKMDTYTMYINANGHTMTASMVANSSTQALKELLQQGSVKINMHDYANFEKVGPLPKSLPRNDEDITTKAGDLILYQGNQFVIYYDTNSWDFTRLGKIDGLTQSELKTILGPGDVDVTLSLSSSSGLSDVTTDKISDDPRYYDLAGRTASSQSKGIVVEKRGSSSRKIIR